MSGNVFIHFCLKRDWI